MEDRWLSMIFYYLKPYMPQFLLLLLCVVSSTIINTFYPLLLGNLVDSIYYEKEISAFIDILINFILVFLVGQILHLILNVMWAYLMTHFLVDIRKDAYSRILNYTGNNLASIKSGDIIYRIQTDIEEFMNFIHWNIFYLFAKALNLIFSLWLIFCAHWSLALSVCIILFIIITIDKKLLNTIKLILQEEASEKGDLTSWIFEILSGLQEIKLLNSAKKILYLFSKKTIKIFRLKIEEDKYILLSNGISTALLLIMQIMIFFFSAFLIYYNNITVGDFVAVNGYIGISVAAIKSMTEYMNNLAGNIVSIERVYKILNDQTEKKEYIFDDFSNGTIKFENVYFSYDKKNTILNNINLEIHDNEKVAIVGYSGAGKSTLIGLLLRFFEPQKGKITIDDKNISDIKLDVLRSKIGIINQDIAVFPYSIRFNLIFSNNKIRDEEIYEVLKKVDLYNFIMSLPQKLDTIINSSRIKLSGGQIQRLAMARVFLKKPAIIIFDEATSFLDLDTEYLIQSLCEELCQNRTIITITHQLHQAANYDKIVLLNNGEIQSIGNHKELLMKSSLYREFYEN